MRRALVVFLPVCALTTGCALVGYDLDGYGRGASSASGGGGAGGEGSASGGMTGTGASTSSGGVHDCAQAPFSAPSLVALSSPPTDLRIADMDGDGYPDVVMISAGSSTVSVIRNDRKGGFEIPPLDTSVSGAQLAAVTVGSFGVSSGTGVVVADMAPLGGVYIFYNKMGELQGVQKLLTCASTSSVVIGDFVGDPSDEFNDIAAVCSDGTGSTLTIFPDVQYGQAIAGASYSIDNVSALIAAKLDKDDQDELVLTKSSGPSPSVYFPKGMMGQLLFPLDVSSAGGRTAVADFNGDSLPDIAVASGDTTAGHVFLAQEPGVFTVAPTTSIDVGAPTNSIVAADFNRDGHVDLAMSGNGSVYLFLGTGDGQVTFTKTELPGRKAGVALQVGDLNNDGWPDLVEGSTTESTISVFLNDCGKP